VSTLDVTRVAPMTPPDFCEGVELSAPSVDAVAPLKACCVRSFRGKVQICATFVYQADWVSPNVPAAVDTSAAGAALDSEVDKLLWLLAADNSA
jgi:hypothetical protein